jgi:hypothetical protein
MISSTSISSARTALTFTPALKWMWLTCCSRLVSIHEVHALNKLCSNQVGTEGYCNCCTTRHMGSGPPTSARTACMMREATYSCLALSCSSPTQGHTGSCSEKRRHEHQCDSRKLTWLPTHVQIVSPSLDAGPDDWLTIQSEGAYCIDHQPALVVGVTCWGYMLTSCSDCTVGCHQAKMNCMCVACLYIEEANNTLHIATPACSCHCQQ